MPERSAVMMDTLLGIHRERDPQAVLRYLLHQMAPEFGSAVACSYLLDEAAGRFRCDLVADDGGEATRTLWRSQVRLPLVLPAAVALPPVRRLAESDTPVQVTEQTPEVLAQLWGAEVAESASRVLRVKFAVVAPVCTPQAPLGALILLVVDGWPVAAAAECVAHAAVALANLCERREPGQAAGHDAETGLSTRELLQRTAERELNRADRYRLMTSLVVAEVPESERTSERMQDVAALVSRVVRQPDTVGLLAPGRIAVLLPETPADGATAFIRRVRQEAGADLAWLRFACAMFPQDGRTWDEIVGAATSRLADPDAQRPGGAIRIGLRAAFPNFRMSGEASSPSGS